MHSAPQSPRPTDFYVTADGADVAGLFTDSRDADAGHDESEQADSERGDFLGAMRASWDDWMPVATTGWGAVVLIAPLFVVHALVWAFGGRRPR